MKVAIIYYSMYGHVYQLARAIEEGAKSVAGTEVIFRRVREFPEVEQATAAGGGFAATVAQQQKDVPIATLDDLRAADAVIFGSPTRYGNMAAQVKAFIDTTAPLWLKGALEGKPACVFTSTASLHGGQETTLVSMMLPLLHHGMLVLGLPYTLAELNATRAGGTPYGASHFAGLGDDLPLSAEERTLCIAQGRRLAEVALKLK